MQVTQEQIGLYLYTGCMLMHAETMTKHPKIGIGFRPISITTTGGHNNRQLLPISQHHTYTITNVTVRVNVSQTSNNSWEHDITNSNRNTRTQHIVTRGWRQDWGDATAGQTILRTSECTTQGAQHLRTFFIQNRTTALNRRGHSVYL